MRISNPVPEKTWFQNSSNMGKTVSKSQLRQYKKQFYFYYHQVYNYTKLGLVEALNQ